MDIQSDAVQRSLRILNEQPCSPAAFARAYFPPDHSGWRRTAKCGPKGVTRGGGLVLWAGGWLGKLRAAGLTYHHHKEGHKLTSAGREAIKEPTP